MSEEDENMNEEDENIVSEFNQAITFIQKAPPLDNITNELQLQFYALFKQATDCHSVAPLKLNIVKWYKWDAWHRLANLSKKEAMKQYIQQLTKLSSNWRAWQPPQPKL